jgi:glycosyltransferase involved in cell wall biosynthesis
MPYPPKDGGTIGILNILNVLAETGNEVFVLAMNTPKHFIKPEEINPEIQKKLNIEYTFVDTKISVFALLKNLVFSKLPYIAERFYNQNYNDKLIEILSNHKFDIIQLEGLYLCTYIPTIRKHSNAKIALRSHNIEHEIWYRTAQNTDNPVKRIYLRHLSGRIKKLKQAIINQYDVLVPITERDTNIYNNLGNTKPYLIFPAIINTNDFAFTPISKPEPKLFHLGALDWFPNQEGLLWFINNCWAELKNTYPDLSFHIAGRNASPDFIKKISVDGVVFHGEVPDSHSFISDYTVMIVPLLSGSGMRIKIIEGMAMGRAIITTTIGTEGIPTTDMENILIADDPKTFITKITYLINNPEKIAYLGKNANIFIEEKYSDKVLAKKLTDFYNSTL